MAQFRLSMTAMSRGTGRKIVAAAAYRSGDRLDDRHYGETHDYSNRQGVVHAEIVLPDNAPEWASDRAALWSAVEDREKADNVTLAREVLLSLPCELTDAQRIELTQEFAQHVAAEYGMAVDMSIHAPSEQGDDRNYHAHVLIATRAFDDDRADGWSKTKDRRFNAVEMQKQGRENAVSEMREAWEGMQNRALERADIRDERGELVQVDRRSYEEKGLEIEPCIHLGYAASAMERRGEDSDRAQVNAEIKQRNAEGQGDRATIRQEWETAKREMAELFEAIAARPSAAIIFRRRERMAGEQVAEVEKPEPEPQRRPSDRMNEMLLGGPSLAELQNEARERAALERQQQEAERQHEREKQRTMSPGFSRGR